jgi:hypothetical protein
MRRRDSQPPLPKRFTPSWHIGAITLKNSTSSSEGSGFALQADLPTFHNPSTLTVDDCLDRVSSNRLADSFLFEPTLEAGAYVRVLPGHERTVYNRGVARATLAERPISMNKRDESKTIAVTRGSGNVFADLGFDNPEEELRKAKLIREARQASTALEIFAMPQPLSAKGERLWRKAMKKVERDRKDRRLNRSRDVDV